MARKKYVRGKRDKICLYITNYVDDVTLSWINSRSVVTAAIWEVIKREAYREATICNQNLVPNDIQGALNISPITQTAYSNQDITNPPQNFIEGSYSNNENLNISDNSDNKKPKHNMQGDGDEKGKSEKVTNYTVELDEFTTNKSIKREENKNLNVNVNANTDNNDDKKDGKLNLNEVFKNKKKVSTLKGEQRTNFHSNKPNKIEMETLGLSK